MGTTRSNLTRDEAAARAAVLRDLHYDVSLDLTRGDRSFGSAVTIRFAATAGSSTFLDLEHQVVHEITLNDRSLDPAEVVEGDRILLADLAADNVLHVRADLAYTHEGRGLHLFRDPTDDVAYLHSQFEPQDAHLVYGCFDQPDLKGRFTFRIQAPADWVVVSNEPVASRPDDGEAGWWVFETTPVLSPYVTAVVAGGYASVHDRHGDVDLGLYVRRSLLEHLESDEVFALTRQGLDWYDANFGITYPFTKYDQLFVPEFSAGAMEHPGCVTFSESYLFRSRVTEAQRERRCETILHEMAHMWFGDLVTMRWWDDLWLNESFATFCSVLSMVEATRFDQAWVTFLDAEKAWAKFQDQLPTTHPIAADLSDVEAVHQNFDGITYAKGASVLRQLVAWVGQDAFLAGCRQYFQDHQWGNATLSDFLAALEGASGRDLGTWRDAWLTTTGVNTLACDFEVADDGTFASFAVVQTAPEEHPTLRPHRAVIGIYDLQDGALVRTVRHELDVTGARTEVPELVGTTAGRVVLPNDDDLTFAKIRLDERSMDTLTTDLARLAEPLPRALVWSATWDMVRDAVLPSSQFVDLVIANLGTESEVGVVQRLTMRALGAAERYAAPEHRPDLLAALATHARHELDRATPGSGHQLVWARQFASAAASPDTLAEVRRLLDGDVEVDGLEVDTELRWHLVSCLARAGALDEDGIAAELERDRTDIGERHAATARAARPLAEAKAEAWQRLVEDPDLSHTLSRHLWNGFQQLSQPLLVEPYVERYFDVLDKVWANRSLEWAIEFSSGMYPHPVATEDTLARSRAVLARDDLPGPLRRTLLEEQDVLERTLRARARDAEA